MAKDFLLNEGALQIINGDFVTGESSQQHVEDVLVARPGEYKQSPFIGVAIEDYLNAPFTPKVIQTLERQINLQLKADGAKKISVKVNSLDNIQIDTRYEG